MTTRDTFVDYAVGPGDIVRALYMDKFDCTLLELAKYLDMDPGVVYRLVRNEIRITVPIAYRLASKLGRPVTFWMQMQRQYDHELARGLHNCL